VVIPGAGCGLNCAAVMPATVRVGETVNFRSFASWSLVTVPPVHLSDFGDRTVPAGGSTPSRVCPAAGSDEWQMTTMVDGVYCGRRGVILMTSTGQTASCRYSQWFQVGTQAGGVGASWGFDVAILSPTTSTAQAQLLLHTTAGVKTLPTTVGALRHVTMAKRGGPDGVSGSGGLQKCSNQPVRANRRTNNHASATNTFRQYCGSYTTNQAVLVGELAWLAGLRIVAVTLQSTCGTRLAGYTVPVASGEWKQQNEVFQTCANRIDVSSEIARVAIHSGSGVIVLGLGDRQRDR